MPTQRTDAKIVGYLPTLDGWRAFAVVAVIFSHAPLPAMILQRAPHWFLTAKSGGGEKGVQLFFAISGFLITSRLIEEWNRMGQISLKRFYVRRVFRILPPATAYLLVIAVLGLLGVLSIQWKYWLASLCFFRNYMWLGGSVFEAHYWTLSVEEQFYLIWPALLVIFGLYRSRYSAAVLILAIWVWRLVSYHRLWGATMGRADWTRAEICFDGLLFGCLYALLLESPTVKAWVSRYAGVGAVVIVLAVVLLSGGRTYTPGGRSLQSLLMPILFIATILNPQSWLGRLLELAALRWVGRLSYSLYIWQQLFTVRQFLPWYSLQLVPLFAVAVLSFYCIEKPMIRLGYRLAPPPSLGHGDLGTEIR